MDCGTVDVFLDSPRAKFLPSSLNLTCLVFQNSIVEDQYGRPNIRFEGHQSCMILRCKKSSPVRYNFTLHEVKSDPNFRETFGTQSVLIQTCIIFFCRKENQSQ